MAGTLEGDRKYTQALGTAVVDIWADLPQEVQEKLFEHAVTAGNRTAPHDSLREGLARYLHDHHERTQAATGTGAHTRL